MKAFSQRVLVIVAVAVLLCVGSYAVYWAATQPHWYGTPNSTYLPAGGISMEMALDRARQGNGPDVSAYAEVRGGWVWHITRHEMGSDGTGCDVNVIIDFFTGKQLDWYLICADNFN